MLSGAFPGTDPVTHFSLTIPGLDLVWTKGSKPHVWMEGQCQLMSTSLSRTWKQPTVITSQELFLLLEA